MNTLTICREVFIYQRPWDYILKMVSTVLDLVDILPKTGIVSIAYT